MSIVARIKKEFQSLHKAFFVYKKGLSYVYHRFWVAPKLLRLKTSLERPVTHEYFSVHMLTSHTDLLIAMWSLAGFYNTSLVIGHLTIHDDGTMTEGDHKIIKKLFPHAHIARVSDFMTKHDHNLTSFQKLITFRKEYKKFQSKKLLDVFMERKGEVILYLDSDLLWFKPSPEIADFVQKIERGKAYMMSNGSERVHVTFKDGTQTSDFVAECNSGVTLFHADDYDLSKLEAYIDNTDYLQKKFTDQACFGSILPNVQILPRDQYFIKGEITDSTIMRHYTGPSREKFFFYGINFLAKKILDSK